MKNLLIGSGLFLAASKYFTQKSSCDETKEKLENAAICILKPDGNNTAKGLVLFKQASFDSATEIEAKISGLKQNAKHGFHIHEFGDLSQGCTTAGPHYNPFGKSHGGENDKERHVGDLGNLQSDANGEAHYKSTNNLVTLVGKHGVIGRSCVVHTDEDDLGRGTFPDSKTTGHSGARIACGVIALCSNDKKI
jgi:Cu-Zn family superoxide dismutase